MNALNITSIPSSPSVLSTSPTTPTNQLNNSSQIMSLQPPSAQPVKMSSNTFVHKLYKYGFHKVNKSPRGHRTLAENQIWEFSHPKFLRGRPDLLDDIKRKAMESETLRRETGDLHAHLAMMQVAQNELLQQIRQLQENFTEVMRDLSETKRKQTLQQHFMKNMWEVMNNSQGTSTTIPFDFNFDSFEIKNEPERPPIYITSPENHTNINYHLISSQNQSPQRPSTPLTVNTNITSHTSQTSAFLNNPMLSGRVSPFSSFNQAVNTPLPPSPSPGSPMGHVSDDDMDGNSSLYCTSPAGSHAGSEYGDDIFSVS
nr:12248_t:CDS:2 [Entrophospora candida]